MMSRETKVVCGATLLTVPTIFYGGLALLGLLTQGAAGVHISGLVLDETQHALFRFVLYLGIASMTISVVVAGIGLLRPGQNQGQN